MKQWVLIFASFYALISVILGAFASHLMKNLLTTEKLNSFEIGIKYQMYNAIILLVLGLYFSFEKT